MILEDKINILHVVRSFDVSGRSRLIHDICIGSKIDGVDPVIVSLSDNCKYKQDDIELINLGYSDGFKLAIVFKLIKLIRRLKINIVHNHGRGSLIYVALAVMFIPRVRLIHTVHRADGDLISSRLFLRKWLLKRVEIITAVSVAAAEKFTKVNGCPADKIKVVYNGIDISKFNVNGVPENDKDGLIIGTVANLSGDKDIETLLKAFAGICADETRDTLSLLRIIGDGPHAKVLHKLAKSLGIYKNVNFMGFRKDIPKQLGRFDVFILSTKTEGFGISILEAMASGVPVVASDVGGVSEIIENDKNGLLFPVGDVDALQKSIIKIIMDDTEKNKLIRNGRLRCKEFSRDIMIKKYMNIYEFENVVLNGSRDGK